MALDSKTIWENLPRYPEPTHLEEALLTSPSKPDDSITADLLKAAKAGDPDAFTETADRLFSCELDVHFLAPIMNAMLAVLSGMHQDTHHKQRADCQKIGEDLVGRVMDWKGGKARETVLHRALTIAALTGNIDIAGTILAEDNVIAFHNFPIYAATKAAASPKTNTGGEAVLAMLVASLCNWEHEEDATYVAALLGLEPTDDLVRAHIEAHKASILTEAMEVNNRLGWNMEAGAILTAACRRFVGKSVEFDSINPTDAFEDKAVEVYSKLSITQCRKILNDKNFSDGNGAPKVLRTAIARRIRAGVGMHGKGPANKEKDNGSDTA